MNTTRPVCAGLMLVLTLAASGAPAQEPAVGEEDLLPAVDTSAAPVEEGPTPEAARSTSGNRVMDEIELSRTEITGNQELPKVLYIVPWKKSDPGNLMGKPVNTLLDEVLAPLDREEFIRQVEYYEDIAGEE